MSRDGALCLGGLGVLGWFFCRRAFFIDEAYRSENWQRCRIGLGHSGMCDNGSDVLDHAVGRRTGRLALAR